MSDKNYEFKELVPPKDAHLDHYHHERSVHQDAATTHTVHPESQRLLCLEAGEGQGGPAVQTFSGLLHHGPACCAGCCCTLLILAVVIFRLITLGDFVSTMPDVVETCVDKKETWCPVVRAVGFCAFFRGPCAYSCTDCVRFDDGGVEEVVIDVEDVPSKLAYAATGSSIPESLQGIWWMDQDGFGAEKGLAGENYPYDFYPVGEYAIGFGDKAVWQPDTLCLTPIYFWGGSRGHWAGANFGNGTTCCGSNIATRLTLSLCATDDTLQVFDIWTRLVIPSVLAPVASSLGFEYAGSDYWWIPKGLIHLTMVKKPWGWDRVNTAAADWTRTKREELDSLLRFLPSQLTSLLDAANRTLHYPMFQLVDGDGNRTEYWDHFVDFTQIKSKQNAVPGTLVVRKRTAPPEGDTHRVFDVGGCRSFLVGGVWRPQKREARNI